MQLKFQQGLISSALEHAVPEQMFSDPTSPTESVSAVKALQLAAQQGQRIYQIDQSNQSQLSNLNLDPSIKAEIRNSLAVGRIAIVHENNVSVPGWTGAGYILFDPETGAGSYKISGGSNGSYLGGLFLGMLIVTTLTLAISTTGGFAFPLLASTLAHAGIFVLFDASLVGGIDAVCFWAGLLAGLTPLFLLAGPFISSQSIIGAIAGAFGYTEAIGDFTETRQQCFGG